MLYGAVFGAFQPGQGAYRCNRIARNARKSSEFRAFLIVIVCECIAISGMLIFAVDCLCSALGDTNALNLGQA